jgi:hypothetical protein
MRWYLFITLLLVCAPRSEAKYSGGSGTAADPYLVSTAQDLLDLAVAMEDWSRHFKQIADIDMNGVSIPEGCYIGSEDLPFSGVFDGAGKTIAHYTCACSTTNAVGLFGQMRGYEAVIRNVTLTDPHVEAEAVEYVGTLVGSVSTGTVVNCRAVRVQVSGHTGVGGLVGWTWGSIIDCEVSGVVQGAYSVGGLTGVAFWGEDTRRCRADVTVRGVNRVGGLVGNCTLTGLHWCSASGDVEGTTHVGGLVGCCQGGVVTNCYATGAACGLSRVGGLLGRNAMSCDCSSGAFPGEVVHCYATGRVTGEEETGGLVGFDEDCIVRGAFWDIETCGTTSSAEGTGLTTAELQTQRTFTDAGWDFTPPSGSEDAEEYWVMRGSASYPQLAWEVVAGDYDGDDAVDLRDFAMLARRWRAKDWGFWADGTDLTGDGIVDGRDLRALCGRWPVVAWGR